MERSDGEIPRSFPAMDGAGNVIELWTSTGPFTVTLVDHDMTESGLDAFLRVIARVVESSGDAPTPTGLCRELDRSPGMLSGWCAVRSLDRQCQVDVASYDPGTYARLQASCCVPNFTYVVFRMHNGPPGDDGSSDDTHVPEPVVVARRPTPTVLPMPLSLPLSPSPSPYRSRDRKRQRTLSPGAISSGASEDGRQSGGSLKWTEKETRDLLEAVETFGRAWVPIHACEKYDWKGRTAKSLEHKWYSLLKQDPSIFREPIKNVHVRKVQQQNRSDDSTSSPVSRKRPLRQRAPSEQ